MPFSNPRKACAACRSMRHTCEDNCVFKHHIPPFHPENFESLHRVFKASNVERLLKDLPSKKRESALRSLIREAETVIRDPVYGCLGVVRLLQNRLIKAQTSLDNVKQQLATYMQEDPNHQNQKRVKRSLDVCTKELDLLNKINVGDGSSGQVTQPTHLTDLSLAPDGLIVSDVVQDYPYQHELYDQMIEIVNKQALIDEQNQQSQSQPNQGDDRNKGKSVDLDD